MINLLHRLHLFFITGQVGVKHNAQNETMQRSISMSGHALTSPQLQQHQISTEWQVKCHWRIDTRHKSVSLIERFGALILGIYQQRIGTNKTACV